MGETLDLGTRGGAAVSELEDLKAAKAERMRGHDEPMMESACWEYACPCHDDLDRAIAIAESLLGDPDNPTVDAGVYWDTCEERDEARAAVLELRDTLRHYWPADLPPLADTESYERYR